MVLAVRGQAGRPRGRRASWEGTLENFYAVISKAMFLAVAVLLWGLAISMVVTGAWQVVDALLAGREVVEKALDSIGLVIISIAVLDLSKFVIEEEVLRSRELRSSNEARRSLTKFMTIIVIAVSLEALVNVFEASRQDERSLVYPAVLLISGVLALVGLSLFQWLSRLSEQLPSNPKKEHDEAKA